MEWNLKEPSKLMQIIKDKYAKMNCKLVKLIFILFLIIKANNSAVQKANRKIIDTETPKNSVPYVLSDSVSKKELKA
jgi:hypothetical protein